MRMWLGGLLGLSILMVSMASVEGADVRDLVTKLKSKDNEVRRAAAKELAELRGDAVAAAPALAKSLSDSDVFVRRFAAEALGAIGPEAKSAIPALAKAMNDSRKEVQLAAVDALGKMGAESTKALTDAVKDTSKDGAVRSKAAQGLAKIGMEARSSVPALSAVLTGKMKKGKAAKGKANDDDIRADVATALGEIATPEDTAAITALKAVSEGKQKNKALEEGSQRRPAEDHRRSAQEEKEEGQLSRASWYCSPSIRRDRRRLLPRLVLSATRQVEPSRSGRWRVPPALA